MAAGKSFAPFKSQNFKPLKKSWLIAQADPVARTVTSVFDEQGQQQYFTTALAEHLRCDEQHLTERLKGLTFGVKVGDEYFIRSVAKIDDDGVHFFCDCWSLATACICWKRPTLSKPPCTTGRTLLPRWANLRQS